MVHYSRDNNLTTIVLAPNRSAGWAENKRLLLLLGIPVAIIAVGWSLAGAVLILPFAGLEFGLLAWFSYRVCVMARQRQVIHIHTDHVLVEEGLGAPQRQWRLARPGTCLAVVEPEKEFDELRLSLIDDRRRLVLGGFLNNDDRARLRDIVRESGINEISSQWWRR
jgi:uncharacterized membrane protein